MKAARRIMLSTIAGLASPFLFSANAHAGCVPYGGPVPHHINWYHQMSSPRLLHAAFVYDDDGSTPEPSMVGTWKEHWTSEGTDGIPDGTEVDAGYA